MTALIASVLFFALCIALFFVIRKRKRYVFAVPDNIPQLLSGHVAYYRELAPEQKTIFEKKVKEFLLYIRIHGVNTEVEDLDKVLVASSAVIPVFGFDKWRYYNLKDVLLYGDRFNTEDFSTTGNERNTLGMVGTGALQQMMILSKPALRQGFQNEGEKNNTGIHEFVHLLDKADGATDGIPEALVQRQYTIPWIKYMSEAIHDIKSGNSDIDIYGAASQAEFFAVAAEYFFKRPDLFEVRHPELFALMEKIFNQQPGAKEKQVAKDMSK
ncbi:M90 family metallopeptidase [Agriterribacter sp.]|uniref:M90 family metallopeptidase n=1 Tax=Agriterribacter sp. TaxID=2821509 RepID=UPI002C3C77DB|nr:M90 family metallopeptidase [Agriterribacter sp.]HTN05873.1 M90 family metallopeptidase [Agriterribacter sp.]